MIRDNVVKTITLSFIAVIIVSSVLFGSASKIICGWQSGEIYFVGPVPYRQNPRGFYRSLDYGENIELLSVVEPGVTHYEFGLLLADAQENTIHRLWGTTYAGIFYTSFDGGYSWVAQDNHSAWYRGWASGIVAGEIYRQKFPPNDDYLERRASFDSAFVDCSMDGYPNDEGISIICLGNSPGEVYAITFQGNLYYSDNYAENFTFKTNVISYGINFTSVGCMYNGNYPGEFFGTNGYYFICRVYDYGFSVDSLFSAPSLSAWYAISSQPGELYSLIIDYDYSDTSTIYIYHTMDYFQTYDLYTHYIPHIQSGIEEQDSVIPGNISLSVYPNPANPDFNIRYTLDRPEPVEIFVHNILGKIVWNYKTEIQVPGEYKVKCEDKNLNSGIYLVKIQTTRKEAVQKMIILK